MCMCALQDALWKRMNAAQSPVVDDDMSAAAQEVAGRMTALARQLYPANDAAAAQAQLVAGAWSHCAQAAISQKRFSADRSSDARSLCTVQAVACGFCVWCHFSLQEPW